MGTHTAGEAQTHCRAGVACWGGGLANLIIRRSHHEGCAQETRGPGDPDSVHRDARSSVAPKCQDGNRPRVCWWSNGYVRCGT